MRGMCSTGEQFGLVFSSMMEKAPADHSFIKFSNESKDTLTSILKAQENAAGKIVLSAQNKIENLNKSFIEFRSRMKAREESRSNYDYYMNKVKKLHEAREKTLASGKQELPKDTQHVTDNEKKLEDATNSFQDVNNRLVNDLTFLWEHRFDYLAPILADVISAETEFAATYHMSLQKLRIPAYPQTADLDFKSQLTFAQAQQDQPKGGILAGHSPNLMPATNPPYPPASSAILQPAIPVSPGEPVEVEVDVNQQQYDQNPQLSANDTPQYQSQQSQQSGYLSPPQYQPQQSQQSQQSGYQSPYQLPPENPSQSRQSNPPLPQVPPSHSGHVKNPFDDPFA